MSTPGPAAPNRVPLRTIHLNLPVAVIEQLKAEAEREDRSLSKQAARILAAGMREPEEVKP